MPRVKAEPGDGSEFSKTYTVVRMNATQAKIINAAFALQDSPNQREVEELSAQTGLTAKWLKSWYYRARRASTRKKETMGPSAVIADVSNVKSEHKNPILHPDKTQNNQSALPVNDSIPLLPRPQSLNSTTKEGPLSSCSRIGHSVSSKFQQNHDHERDISPQLNTAFAFFQKDSSAPPFPESFPPGDLGPMHAPNNLPHHYPQNIHDTPLGTLIPLFSHSVFSPSNEQRQYSPVHPNVPANEPESSRDSSCTLPINQPPSPSNIQDQHTYCGHYSAGTSSLVIRPFASTPLSAHLDDSLTNTREKHEVDSDTSIEALAPPFETCSSPHLDFSSLAAQLSSTPFSEYRPLVGSDEHSYDRIPSSMYADTAEKARGIVLRSLDAGLVERDPFQAAMGLVVLSRLGLQWD